MDTEYNNYEESQYQLRMKKWGMHTKAPYDVTIEDCLSDLSALRAIHKDSIKGIIIIPIYDHLDMSMLNQEIRDKEYIDWPPTNSYLCSGGVPVYEAVGNLEAVKIKILS